ncbi:MAG: helix-turn-helix domain-containing protein [Steroidobacteraceae bacterium]
MSQNVFFDTGFSDEDATVYALEADCGAAIAGFIHSRFAGNQTAAAKQLGLHQSEVSALLAGNLARFSLSKLIRIARRAGIRLYLDMGDNAHGASASTLRPTVVAVPVNEAEADLSVELAPGRVQPTPAGKRIATKQAQAKRH